MKKMLGKRFFSLVMMLVMVVSVCVVGNVDKAEAARATLCASAHMQSYGWRDMKGSVLGDMNHEGKRMEAIKLKIENSEYSGGIMYRSHIQGYGWEQKWSKDGEISGTMGEARRIEAVQIKLYGELAKHYVIFYHPYIQNYDMMGMAYSSEVVGSEGMGLRLEGLAISFLPAEDLPKYSVTLWVYDGLPYFISNKKENVEYSTHMQTYGWMPYSANGMMGGISGEAKRMEALQIRVNNTLGYSGGITYRTHVQTYGWLNWVKDDAMSGTSGEAKRLEAIEIKLYGELANKYDVYYRVHSQTYGWLGWAKNGAPAGTEGLAKRLEDIQIVLVKKGGSAPGSTANSFIKK